MWRVPADRSLWIYPEIVALWRMIFLGRAVALRPDRSRIIEAGRIMFDHIQHEIEDALLRRPLKAERQMMERSI